MQDTLAARCRTLCCEVDLTYSLYCLYCCDRRVPFDSNRGELVLLCVVPEE